jgi:hypothetical protein
MGVGLEAATFEESVTAHIKFLFLKNKDFFLYNLSYKIVILIAES